MSSKPRTQKATTSTFNLWKQQGSTMKDKKRVLDTKRRRVEEANSPQTSQMGQPRNEEDQHGMQQFEPKNYPMLQIINVAPTMQQVSPPASDPSEVITMHWTNFYNNQHRRDKATFGSKKNWNKAKNNSNRSPRQPRKNDDECNPSSPRKQVAVEPAAEEVKISKSHTEFYNAPYPAAAASFCHQNFTSDLVTYQPFQLLYHQAPQPMQIKRKQQNKPLQVWDDIRYYNPADRFLAHAHLLHVTETPDELVNGSQWDKLSKAVWDKFVTNQQSEVLFCKKMSVWKTLFHAIKKCFPRWGLYLVGSTMTGLASDLSDVDMCLLVKHMEIDQRHEAVFYLQQVLANLWEYIENPQLIQAKVPILKFCDMQEGIEIDLNCNNVVGIRNTHLLYCYTRLDWRLRPLVLVVKLWAQKYGINDAKNMTLSSYSLSLMVINYLQCGVSPPVLPSLQVLYPEKFNPHSFIHNIDIHEELPPYKSANKQPLGELFLGFLEYYSSHFDYANTAVSVRTASVRPIEECRRARTFKNDPHQWKFICVEEPFELTNTARSVYDPLAFERVKSVFVNSWLHLQSKHDLNSLFLGIE
ncbi:poly(A) RNA polymerase gld-2 homolog A-like isoform X4 [Neocloeon triangulifer]|uniref:poly(A) RNA polymerase gld-2 homolog A-like isoform X4 n=1 Tax=Neocloeon triangulifer TaxID=2078957 RepID=UPI00286EE278|nr:poly(A) RNA polymerase gld-2 homolog A-like isoform X4 [Neocloeon triangulifer]